MHNTVQSQDKLIDYYSTNQPALVKEQMFSEVCLIKGDCLNHSNES